MKIGIETKAAAARDLALKTQMKTAGFIECFVSPRVLFVAAVDNLLLSLSDSWHWDRRRWHSDVPLAHRYDEDKIPTSIDLI